MRELRCTLLIIGAGPGGYACAARAGRLGIDTVVVDPTPPGGTCLNVGCIPSKALIHAADQFAAARAFGADADHPLGIRAGAATIDLARTVSWKNGIVERLNDGVRGLFRQHGVRHIDATAHFIDGKTVDLSYRAGRQHANDPQRLRAEHVVIATGSRTLALDALPFGGPVISSADALSLTETPRRLIVIGAGYIGLELGTAFAKLGSEVSVVEAGPALLPQYDAELTRPLARRLDALGVAVLTDAVATGVERRGDAATLRLRRGDRQQTLTAERILLAVGRRPAVDGFGLESLGLDRDGTALAIDDRCQTSMRGVYAIGDVSGEPMLAHRASAQGVMVAERLAGFDRRWDKVAMPMVCFTDPQLVSVGLSPPQARDAGYDFRTGLFPLRANGRALTAGRDDGFVRVVARADNHLLLGAQAVGAGVGELAAAFTLALEMGARLEDLADSVFAHPTRGEALQDAALAALGAEPSG